LAGGRISDAGCLNRGSPRRLWTLRFLVAPFTEPVTGFGVGCTIALGVLLHPG
jgi:lactate permease